MSATPPRRWRCSGRAEPAAGDAAIPSVKWSRRCSARRDAAPAIAAMLDQLDVDGALRPAQARDRRAADRRLGAARQDGGRAFGGRRSMRSRRCGTASRRPMPRCSTGRDGRAQAEQHAGGASARSCWRIRSRTSSTRSISPIMPPSGNGTASASSSSMPAARRGSTAAPATTSPAAFPTSPRRSRGRACSTASCW